MTIRVVLDCALQRAEVHRRTDFDERGCRRNADSNARDLRSDAVIARAGVRAIDQLVVEGAAA
jgi:hypothetical protein